MKDEISMSNKKKLRKFKENDVDDKVSLSTYTCTRRKKLFHSNQTCKSRGF